MPTATAPDLGRAAQSLCELAQHALQEQSADDMELLERHINELDAAVRELQQSMWAREVKATIGQLEGNKPLSDADREVIRAFLVSDAERYLTQENNYNDWVHELQRLLREIAHRTGNLDRDSVADLRGVLKDAVRLVPDIRNYLDERRRVELFNQGLHSPDAETRATLARLLRDQLYSPRL